MASGYRMDTGVFERKRGAVGKKKGPVGAVDGILSTETRPEADLIHSLYQSYWFLLEEADLKDQTDRMEER
jgi:hypothetical protein